MNNNNNTEETLPKTVGDEGQVTDPGDNVWGLGASIARAELSHVLSRSILAAGDVPENTERLRERIRYLENVVYEQNEALLRNESKERTHAAALRLLETTKTENSVLQCDRDRLFTENKFNKEQAQETFQKLERFKERHNEQNSCFLQTRQEWNEKVVKLENELERYKGIYESVVPRDDSVGQTEQEQAGELDHTEPDQAVELGHTEPSQAGELGQTEPSKAGELDHTEQEQAGELGQTESSQAGELGQTEPSQAGELDHTEPSNKAEKLKGHIDASRVTDSMSPVRKRKCTFLKTKTKLPSCMNCMTVFDKLRPYQEECRFHRSFPQPLKAWQHEIEVHISGNHGYKFWPCCGKISIKKPPGCLKLKHHDLLYPDPDDD